MLQHFKKNPQRENHGTEGCIIFPKKEFFRKVDQHCFGLTIVFHHAMSFQKNCH